MLSEHIYQGKRIENYHIIAEISSSPSSSVYLAEHPQYTQYSIVMKLFHPKHVSAQKRELFLQEVQLLKKVKHAQILPILDAGIYKNMPYYVTEYATKGSLRDMLDAQSPQLLPVQEALRILREVGQTLQYTHQMNMIHGNLKPENILFHATGDVLLTDFSIVTLRDTFNAEDDYSTSSLPYMAPEQFLGRMHKESDQYGLGCIAYELLTGQTPFRAIGYAQFREKHTAEKPIAPTQRNLMLPISYEEAILKALEKKSEDRYPAIKDFVTAVNSITFLQPHGVKLPQRSSAIVTAQPMLVAPMRIVERQAIDEPQNELKKDLSDAEVRLTAEGRLITDTELIADAQLTDGARLPQGDKLTDGAKVIAGARLTADAELTADGARLTADAELAAGARLTARVNPTIYGSGDGRREDVSGSQGLILLQTGSTNSPDGISVTNASVKHRAISLADTTAKVASMVAPIFGGNFAKNKHNESKRALRFVFAVAVALLIVTLSLMYNLRFLSLPSTLTPKLTTISHKKMPTVSATIPLLTPTARPTVTHEPASKAAPTLGASPTATPSPMPTTLLMVTPSSFQLGKDCLKQFIHYICTANLLLPQDFQGNLKWSASGSGGAIYFNPPRGILSPGQGQQVTIFLPGTCPRSGTIAFSTKSGVTTVPWSC